MRPPPPRRLPPWFWTWLFLFAVVFGVIWAIVPGGPPPWSAWLWLIVVGMAAWMRWAEWRRARQHRSNRGGGY